jgi:two-component system chemotaxis sensor kinase CheA
LSANSEDRFREMFFEEARELLIGLEEGLMDLERRRSDRAHLDKTFRAAHTLKGAAAMVGLAVIAEFTNGIEAVLDRIRAGALAVDSEIISTLLEARDHLAAMVEADAARSPIPPSGELTQRLTALFRGPGGATPPAFASPVASHPPAKDPPAAGPPPPPEVAQQGPTPPVAARPKRRAVVPQPRAKKSPKTSPREPGTRAKPRARRGTVKGMGPSQPTDDAADPSEITNHGENVYRIILAPGPDVLRRGINPLGVLDELRELGEATLVADLEAVPLLDQLDPERCYLSWQITIKSDQGPERLEEAFLFFTEDSTITIERKTTDGKFVPLPTSAVKGASAVIGTTAAGSFTSNEAPPTLADISGSSMAAAPTLPAAPLPAAQPSLPFTALAATMRGAPATMPTAARPHSRIRVDAAQLDELVGLAGELVVVTDNLMGVREIKGVESWSHALEALERVSRQIRDTTLDLRMVPVDELFSRFPRVVRDLADRSGKEIELRIVGQETRLDRTIVERLSDPMIHLIRNGVDHALENPAERLEKGKPRVGRITLSAGHEGDRVAIRVEDDGRGLDRERIVRKGIALGMVPTGTAPDDPRVVGLIFEPGFSTRDTISELSGRGVGLDVVRDAVRALRGSVAVESSPGKGTAFIFRLPLTLALIDGLLVETGDGRYVVPLAQVEECVALNGTRSALAEARPCVAVRGELVPIVSLRNLFHANGSLPARQELLLTRHAGQRVGIAVDRLVGRVQAVIQSLGEGLHGLSRFSGATILGDGTVSLILDLSALVSESRTAENSARHRPLGRTEGGD